MRDVTYVRPWEGKVARCPACGSTAVFTDWDKPFVDDDRTTKMFPIDGGTPTVIGIVTFWKPCASCHYRMEWSILV